VQASIAEKEIFANPAVSFNKKSRLSADNQLQSVDVAGFPRCARD
jgi:hypothetical protein